MNEMTQRSGLPVLEFRDEAALRGWFQANAASSAGIWIRLYRVGSEVASVTFEQALDQALCFGWSESQRSSFDRQSYLQKCTPRKTRGTTSTRNLVHARKLIAAGQMTASGLAALVLD